MSPVYVDPFLGAGAAWLCLLDARLVALVSWMGGKRRLARRILARLGLDPGTFLLGQRIGKVPPCLLGDASWWGWVWPVCLDPITGPRVAAILRSWRGEDPRALWFRLRAAGPFADPCEAAAQLLWLQARAASGVPVWWEGSEVLAAPGDGRSRQLAADRGSNGLIAQAGPRADGSRGSCGASMSGDKALSERLVKTNTAGDHIEDGCCKGNNERGAGGIVDPGTIAGRLDAIRASMLVKASGGEAGFGYDDGVRRGKGWRLFEPGDVADRVDRIRASVIGDVRIEHRGARELTEEWAPRIGSNGRVYLDPPYLGATGYPAVCPREEVLWIAEEWARHGACVVLSESCGLAAELGSGWVEEQLPSTKKPEWITVWAGRAAA